MPHYAVPSDIEASPTDREGGEQQQFQQARPVTTNDLFILFQELLRNQRSQVPAPTQPRLPVELPKFAGRPADSLSLWLFQVDSIFSARGIFELDRLPYLPTCLSEAALAWFHNWHLSIRNGTSAPIMSWNEFSSGIRTAFEPPRQQQLLRNQLRKLKQTGSAQDYTYLFRALMGQINHMDEEDKISYYVHGLSPKLRSEVEVKEPNSLEDAAKIAITIDGISTNGWQQHLTFAPNTARHPQLPRFNTSEQRLHEKQQSKVSPMELGSIAKDAK